MNIAIATCTNLPSFEKDDQQFFESLSEHNIKYKIIAWDADKDWSQFDACLIRTTWDYQERIDQFREWLEKVSKQTTLINSKEVILWNSHKSYLKELEDSGIDIAPSEWLFKGGTYDIKSIMQKRSWNKGFIKPLVGANARECCRFDLSEKGLKAAQEHINRLSAVEDLVLQPYLESVEKFGETSGIFFSHQLSHGVLKVPVKGDFRVQDDYGAKDYVYDLKKQEQAVAEKALIWLEKKFGTLLYARIDFLHGQNGEVYLNEIELIEPSLFFRHGKKNSAEFLVKELMKRLKD